MSWIEVLVEGSSDVPVLREVLTRKFSLTEGLDFRIHPHQGKGSLPSKPSSKAELHNRSLLHQLPSKLRGFSNWFTEQHWVLVVIDADDTPYSELLNDLDKLLNSICKPPRVLFRIAVEETESWFIADIAAVKKAYPNSNTSLIKRIQPDAVCGAWEKLAETIQAKGKDKTAWAEKISPYLNLDNPTSPSFKKLLSGIERELKAAVN